MAMDNMQIRKTQLEKLDQFVHTLYQETQTFKQYGVDLKDLEILYLHIHDLIQELLQCNTTEEFMEMLEELHKAVAGVLIIAIPANAADIVNEMKGAHEGMSDLNVDEFLKNMKVRPKSDKSQQPRRAKQEEEEDEVDEEKIQQETNDLVDQLELGKYVKPGVKREYKNRKDKGEDTPSEDESTEESTQAPKTSWGEEDHAPARRKAKAQEASQEEQKTESTDPHEKLWDF